ncbi:MAG: lasso RiPP family leader peptide-containing protein, partial [Gemmatimonadaceae bacterium]
PPSRAPYVSPRLAVYGPVAELTQTVGSRGKHDRFLSRKRTGF